MIPPRVHLTRVAVTAASVLAAATLAGCGGDDADDGPKAGDASSSGSAAESCDGTDVTATFPDGTEVDLDQSIGIDVGSGAAFTLYAADFPLEDVSPISGVVPGEGDRLATLAITTFNAPDTPEQVEEGRTIEWTGEFGVLTFSVVLNEGPTASGNTAGAAGTVEVRSLDDATICVDVDYSDDEKSLVGTISADIV